MIERSHTLSVVRQCVLLDLSRSSVYYTPPSVAASALALMRRIDELHLNHPFAGTRMLRGLLAGEGLLVGRRHVATLMKKMGIEALYQRPNTSRKHPHHAVFPYLLRGLDITRANHVWAMDITFVPMRKGTLYLAAVLDWATRRVLAWRLSNTLTTDFCLEAVEEALHRYGPPDLFNTDQGQSIHQPRLRRPDSAPWHSAQHGWPGPLGRQRLRRTTLEERQIRGDLFVCLRLRGPSPARPTPLFHLLQPTPPAFLP
jgi:putative transposase